MIHFSPIIIEISGDTYRKNIKSYPIRISPVNIQNAPWPRVYQNNGKTECYRDLEGSRPSEKIHNLKKLFEKAKNI